MWFTKWLERKLARPCAPHLLQSPDMGHCDDGEGRRESGRTEPAEWLGRDPHAQHSRAHNGMSAGMSVPCEPEPCRVDSHVTLPHATWRLPPRASPARRTASGLGPLVPHTERGCMTCTAPSRRRRHDHDPYRHGRHGRGARELAPRTGVRAARPRLGHASEAQRGAARRRGRSGRQIIRPPKKQKARKAGINRSWRWDGRHQGTARKAQPGGVLWPPKASFI